MKLTIERSTLLKALGHVQSVVERRNTIPILSNVKMDAAVEGLALTATDMDIEVAQSAVADVAQAGAATAPAHTLFEIVRKLPDGAQVGLAYAAEDSRLTLRSGRARFMLSCLPVEDFPTMVGGDYSHAFTLTGSELLALIDRTKSAISTEETRYYLNGVFLHAAGSEGAPALRAVATDGHRLARAECPLPDQAAGMPGVIVPRKTVSELRKLVEEGTPDVSIALSAARIRFSLGGAVLTSKLIDGAFPDYERVIPQDNDKLMEVDKTLFSAAVDRVSAISAEKSRAIKIAVDKGSAILSASSPEAGSAVEEVECSYSASPLEIGFNCRYLLDILAQIEGDAARFALADAASPTVIRDVADASAVYVLMPMRV